MLRLGRMKTESIFDLISTRYPSDAAFARAMKVSRQAVMHWKRDQIPIKKAPKAAQLLGLTPHDIRPDFFQR